MSIRHLAENHADYADFWLILFYDTNLVCRIDDDVYAALKLAMSKAQKGGFVQWTDVVGEKWDMRAREICGFVYETAETRVKAVEIRNAMRLIDVEEDETWRPPG